MNRRAVLSTLGVGLCVCGAGCLGGGSEVVTTVQRSVSVTPGQGWIERIPDVSGGAIQYKARADRPFDVYFFVGEEDYMFYDTFTDGGEPARTPAGDEDVGTSAERASQNSYEAATPNGGARQSIDGDGPYFFVVDHSGYRGSTPPAENPTELSVFLDLTVTEGSFTL